MIGIIRQLNGEVREDLFYGGKATMADWRTRKREEDVGRRESKASIRK